MSESYEARVKRATEAIGSMVALVAASDGDGGDAAVGYREWSGMTRDEEAGGEYLAAVRAAIDLMQPGVAAAFAGAVQPGAPLDALATLLLRGLLELGVDRAREALRLLGERVEASDVG